MPLFAIIIAACFWVTEVAVGRTLWKTPTDGDSLAVRTERGVELTRQSELLSWSEKITRLTDLKLRLSWRSDWVQPGGEAERRRQDGRWHLFARHQWKPNVAFWFSKEGEFFDERAPRSKFGLSGSSISPTTIRIMRGGGGLRVHPIAHTELVGGGGIIEDRRFGHVSSGPLWEAAANLLNWDVSGYVQNLNLEAREETPGCHYNRDLHARYEARREFSPGTANRLGVSASEIRRSYFFDTTSRLSTRKETHTRFDDRLTYAILPDLSFEVEGELLEAKTEIAQGQRKSSLKEKRAAINARVVHRTNRLSGKFDIGLQEITQTIDDDILQGRQANLSLGAGYLVGRRDSLFSVFEVTKYQLDTRNPGNDDDRDELRFAFLVGGVGAWSPYLGWETWARATLDHLVYIFENRSANNRWTRLFLLGAKLRHRPTRAMIQTFGFEVSANYQDFDFELDPRKVRSTVFRRLVMEDSLALALGRALSVVARITWKREELGRLFWHEFQEERSDEVTSVYSTLEFPWRIGRRTELALGGLWNHRRGIRFPDSELGEKEVFQDLQTYGPLWRLRYSSSANLAVDSGGRVVRQLELGREDRWLVMGEIGVVVKW